MEYIVDSGFRVVALLKGKVSRIATTSGVKTHIMDKLRARAIVVSREVMVGEMNCSRLFQYKCY